MAITNTTNEVRNGTRKTRAQGSLTAGDQSAKGRGHRSRDTESGKAPRVTSRPLPGCKPASRPRRQVAAVIVELTIDLDDDRVLDAVAQLLLDLVPHEPEANP